MNEELGPQGGASMNVSLFHALITVLHFPKASLFINSHCPLINRCWVSTVSVDLGNLTGDKQGGIPALMQRSFKRGKEATDDAETKLPVNAMKGNYRCKRCIIYGKVRESLAEEKTPEI